MQATACHKAIMQTTSRYRVRRLTFWLMNASNLEMHGLVNAFDYYDTARPNLYFEPNL